MIIYSADLYFSEKPPSFRVAGKGRMPFLRKLVIKKYPFSVEDANLAYLEREQLSRALSRLGVDKKEKSNYVLEKCILHEPIGLNGIKINL